jgi:Uma2 family endonuclease
MVARVGDFDFITVEVSSRSAKSIDRREKMNAYTALGSLVDYWIVDPDRRSVEVWHRGAPGWARATFMTSAILPVTCLGVELMVADIFADL